MWRLDTAEHLSISGTLGSGSQQTALFGGCRCGTPPTAAPRIAAANPAAQAYIGMRWPIRFSMPPHCHTFTHTSPSRPAVVVAGCSLCARLLPFNCALWSARVLCVMHWRRDAGCSLTPTAGCPVTTAPLSPCGPSTEMHANEGVDSYSGGTDNTTNTACCVEYFLLVRVFTNVWACARLGIHAAAGDQRAAVKPAADGTARRQRDATPGRRRTRLAPPLTLHPSYLSP